MAFEPRYLVVHTAVYRGRNCDREVIDHWHRQRGWTQIGYHYVIINDRHDSLDDGTIQEGRPKDRMGAHVLGLNSQSLGICCVGHGDYDPLTNAQSSALIRLLSDLIDENPDATVERIIGHREINDLIADGIISSQFATSKTCPGKLVKMDDIRDEVRRYRALPSEAQPRRRRASDKRIAEAIGILERSMHRFDNSRDELSAFLYHPEVIELRREVDNPGD